MSEQQMVPAEMEMPEEVDDALARWALATRLLSEPLRPHMLADAYLAGLVHAGIKAEFGKAWGTGKYPRKLRFVLEFPCPFDHRTPDQYDYAKVRIVIRDGGGWSYDPASPCPHCTGEAIRDWMLTCPLDEVGEDSERHYPDHSALDVGEMYDLAFLDYSDKPEGFEYDDSRGGFDYSPLAWVLREFRRMERVAHARWWTEHTDDAAAAFFTGGKARLSDEVKREFVFKQVTNAHAVLGAQPKAKGKLTTKPAMTTEQAAVWLDGLTDSAGEPLAPSTLGQTATWNRVKDIAGCPPQSVIYAAVKLRKSRATVP